MARYLPPTRVKNINIPWKAMVVRADPDFEAAKRKDTFYRFSNGRSFTGNTATHGAYSNETPDNPDFD